MVGVRADVRDLPPRPLLRPPAVVGDLLRRALLHPRLPAVRGRVATAGRDALCHRAFPRGFQSAVPSPGLGARRG
eukprot:8764851-Alexandrium_andersonii.AAC.1